MPRHDVRDQTAILRLSAWEKQAIENRAKSHDLTLSEYMRRCALGNMADPSTLEERVNDLEVELRGRLEKLERMAELGAY